ncbi:hypothetical protein M5689_000620 [Euphorbia peplus]|nr:hypothetical protein M5689_000620 [Euphorbia peplus]
MRTGIKRNVVVVFLMILGITFAEEFIYQPPSSQIQHDVPFSPNFISNLNPSNIKNLPNKSPVPSSYTLHLETEYNPSKRFLDNVPSGPNPSPNFDFMSFRRLHETHLPSDSFARILHNVPSGPNPSPNFDFPKFRRLQETHIPSDLSVRILHNVPSGPNPSPNFDFPNFERLPITHIHPETNPHQQIQHEVPSSPNPIISNLTFPSLQILHNVPSGPNPSPNCHFLISFLRPTKRLVPPSKTSHIYN